MGITITDGITFSANGFSPITLFTNNEQGAWYDPSDLTTLFQDTAGTIPVTAAGQSVARINDKSGRGNHATQANLAQRPLYQIDSGGRPFLLFDGSDDGMATGNIVPGTDKAQVFAGVRKLSDAARGVVAELGNVPNNSRLEVGASANAAGVEGDFYRVNGRGDINFSTPQVASAGGFPAPITNVVTGLLDIAAPVNTLRVDGVQAAQSTVNQGTGNYLTYPLFIGRRGGTSLPFNGRIYGLLVRFGANLSAAQIAQTEAFMAAKTGVTIP
jgi:hypothetical protein